MIMDLRARSGQFCQAVILGTQTFVTRWPSRGARDRFALAIAATESYHNGSRYEYQVHKGTLYPAPIHVSSRPTHWS